MRAILIDFLILILISLIPLRWFPAGFMVTGHDAGYPINIIETFKDRLYTWNTVESLGRNNTVNLGAIPIHAVEAALFKLGLSIYDAQKVFFVLWFFAMLTSMYWFAYRLKYRFPYRYFPLIAAVFYGVNYYLLALWRYGAGTTFSSYTALPLVMTQLIALFDGRQTPFKAGLISAGILFIFNGGGGFSLPLFGGLLIATGVAVIYFWYLRDRLKKVQFFIDLTVGCAVFVFFSVLFHAYWLLPFLSYVVSNFAGDVAVHGGTAGVIAWTDAVSKFTSFSNLFRLQGFPDWYEGLPHPYAPIIRSNPFFIVSSLVFPAVSYAALVIVHDGQKRKLLGYFALLSLVALFFSAGTHEPTRMLFIQFLERIPGFAVFRSAQYKFIPALYFSFAVLFSFSLSSIMESTARKVVAAGLSAFVIIALLVYHYPYFSRSFFTYNSPLTTLLSIPKHVFAYDEWIRKSDNDTDRILILPPLSRSWKSEVYTWNYFSLYSLFNLISPKPYLEYSQTIGDSQYALIERFSWEALNNGSHLKRFATLLAAPLALVRGDSHHALEWIRSENPDDYVAAFENYDFPQEWQSGLWTVYRLPYEHRGKIYGIHALDQYVGHASGITGALLGGSTHFANTDSKQKQTSRVPGAFYKATISASSCSSCILDEEISLPETYASVLPGSFLYPVKAYRERNLEDPGLAPSKLLVNRLTLSIKRSTEVYNLVLLKRDRIHIDQTIETLEALWQAISDSVGRYEIGEGNLDLLRRTEAYARRERWLLVQSYLKADEKAVKDQLKKTIAVLDLVVATVTAHRSYWINVVEYPVSRKERSGRIFFDRRSVPNGRTGLPIVPIKVEISGTVYPVVPEVTTETVSLGAFPMNEAASIRLHMPEKESLLDFRGTEAVVGPEDEQRCAIYDISSFYDRGSYLVSVTTTGPSDAVRLYVRKSFNNGHEVSSTDAYLTKVDRQLPLDRYSKTPQVFIYEPENEQTGASVFFCTGSRDEPEKYLKDIAVYPRFAPTLYVDNQLPRASADIQKVSYRKVDQTRYEVDLSTATFPMILVFNENYNRGFRLYDTEKKDKGSARFADTWFMRPMEEDLHFAMYGYANAWYVEKAPKGTLILEFYPQQEFHKGLVLTGVGIVFAAFVFAGSVRLKKLKKL